MASPIAETWVYATMLIDNEWGGRGTGFLVARETSPGKGRIFLVTNKHVLHPDQQQRKKATHIRVHVNRKKANGTIEGDVFIVPLVGGGKISYEEHPDRDVDVLAFDVTQLTNAMPDLEMKWVGYDLFLNNEKARELEITMGEEVVIVGYPLGLRHRTPNLPLIRSGIIATRIGESLEDEVEEAGVTRKRILRGFLIDGATIPGSSGSPVVLKPVIGRIVGEAIQIGTPPLILLGIVAETRYAPVELKNYRCFPDEQPARFSIRPGFTAFIGANKSSNEAILRLTEDIKNLFGFNYLEINATPDNRTLQVFIDGKSYKLPELGSGIAQFIIVLGNAAVWQPSFVLIDEPELNLHPSLQMSFLTTLTSYATEGVLFGTHNVGLARSSAERTYSLRRLAEGRSEMHLYEAVPDLAQFLGELGYAGYRELGIEKVLLAEGPSDVRTLRQFLRKHAKEHYFLVLPLGGASLINQHAEPELMELQRISGHVHALIDSERKSPTDPVPADRLAFKQICERLGIGCHVLDRCSLDNYLSDAAVKRVKGGKYRALGPYESLSQLSPAWSKAEGWRMAMEMSLTELDGTDLGEFLTSL